MAIVNLSTIKSWFKNGLKPTQDQFDCTWDSFWHKNQLIPSDKIEGFDAKLIENLNENYLSVLQQYKTSSLDTMRLKFSWGFTNMGDTQRSKYSSTIDGNYYLLAITFDNFDVLKSENSRFSYSLLIDRYRAKERKGSRNGKEKNSRKSKYRHEIADEATGKLHNNRINEIVIDNSTMILDFNQDRYFKNFGSGFPQPTGASSTKNINRNRRKGWTDLGFRIRLSNGNTTIHETPYLGFIRMVSDDPIEGARTISYSLI